jgi:hypothetical protein
MMPIFAVVVLHLIIGQANLGRFGMNSGLGMCTRMKSMRGMNMFMSN